MASDRFQRPRPQRTELANLIGRQQRRRIPDPRGQLPADHCGIDIQWCHSRHIRIECPDDDQIVRLPPAEITHFRGDLARAESAQIVETHLSRQCDRQPARGRAVHITQQTVTDPLVRHREQLFLHRLEHRAQCRSPGERILDIAGRREPHREDRGEPADRAGQIGPGHDLFLTTVALEPDQQRILGRGPGHPTGPPRGGGEYECGEQAVVHTAVEQLRHGGEQRLGDFRRHLHRMDIDRRGGIDHRIHRAAGQQWIGGTGHGLPVLQFRDPLRAVRMLLERMRPGPHRSAGRRQFRLLPGTVRTSGQQEIGSQHAPGHPIDHHVMRDDDQVPRSVGGIRFQPDEPDHHAGAGIEPIQRGIDSGLGCFE